MDNCLVLGTETKASKQARWEYFASSESATAGGFVNVAQNANGGLLDLTDARGIQHMLNTCITDETKGLSGAGTYSTVVKAMTDLTSTGLKAWYDTQMSSLTTNANWANAYVSGTANYYQQMFHDETLTNNANTRNTLGT